MEDLSTTGGRTLLAYTESGDPGGSPVLVQHGMIASIRDAHLFDRLIDAGSRVISIARPGYGRSLPYAMRDMSEWGEIVAVLADELGLSQFDVLGISSGAPYSYAIGYALPDRVRRVFILSGTPALYASAIQALWPYPITRDATIPDLQRLAQDLFFSHLAETTSADAMSADIASADVVSTDVRDSMMNDCFGIAQDLRLRCRDWGFRLSDIRVPVIMQHSRLDTQVPFVTAEMTARLLPDCRFIVREDGEHFSVEVLNAFIEEAMVGAAGALGLHPSAPAAD